MKTENKITIGEAVRLVRTHRRMTIGQLADQIPGYDGGNLSRFERNKQSIAEDKLTAIAGALNTTVAALYLVAECGDAGVVERKLKSDYATSNVVPSLHSMKRVPVIPMSQAGKWYEACEDVRADEWRETSAKVGSRAYAFKMVGDSMTNPYGHPSIPEGAYVIADPDIEAVSGSIVVASWDGSGEVTAKKLIIDGPHKYLIPLNPNYKPIEINDNCKIIGVIKQVEIML